MNAAPARYADAWESFWRDAPPEKGAVFWDAPSERTGAVHLPLLAPYFDGALPVVDMGCGNGTMTRFLARRYGPVVGVDISATALGKARGAARADGAGDAGGSGGGRSGGGPERVPEFRRLDAADPAAAAGLGAELGDSDVYVRGVLHQCDPDARARIAASVAVLTGERGRAFVVEPSEAGGAALAALTRRPEGPPAALAAVFEHGIRPMEMADASVPVLFRDAGLGVLAEGTVPLALTVAGADGEPLELPSNWLVAGRNG